MRKPKPDFEKLSALHTPDAVRLAQLANGSRPVNWAFLDEFVRKCTAPGHLKQLSDVCHVSVSSLRARRRELKMPKLKPGRPKKETLSTSQRQLLFKFNQGKRMTTIAEELGTSPQAQYQSLTKAMGLVDPCKTCKTRGTVPCGSDQWGLGRCNTTSAHDHVCLDCAGEGYIKKGEPK